MWLQIRFVVEWNSQAIKSAHKMSQTGKKLSIEKRREKKKEKEKRAEKIKEEDR